MKESKNPFAALDELSKAASVVLKENVLDDGYSIMLKGIESKHRAEKEKVQGELDDLEKEYREKKSMLKKKLDMLSMSFLDAHGVKGQKFQSLGYEFDPFDGWVSTTNK